jgi:hypothetical protein
MIEKNFWPTSKSTCESYSILEDMDGDARYAGHTRKGFRQNMVQKGKDDRIYVVAYKSVRLANNAPAWEFDGIVCPRDFSKKR